ncbi:hypothetical protein [Streptomyces sp. NPDC059701]
MVGGQEDMTTDIAFGLAAADSVG